GALFDRAMQRVRIRLQIINAVLILDLPVRIRFSARPEAVLHHINRQTIARVEREQCVAKRLRIDGPAHAGALLVGWRVGPAKPKWRAGIGLGVDRGVMIEAEPVDRPANAGEVAWL